MFVPVSALVAEPSLRLTALVTSPHPDAGRISWVSTTELPDPLPFLRGGELVLTTGLLERTDEQWRDLVVRLARLPAAALCFGTGLVHPQVPEAVVDAAAGAGLTLIESPVDVPFVQISRWVADRVFARRYEAIDAAVRIQDGMVRELLAGGGLPGLLRRLHDHLDAGAVAVLEPDGRTVARHPTRSGWTGRHDATADGDDPPVEVPTMLGDVPVALLRTERATPHRGLVSFAANLFGLEFARQQAVRTGRREMLGQIIEDIVLRTRGEGDARRSLALHGVAADDRHRVVVAQPALDRDRLRHAPWTLDQPLASETDPLPVALVRDTVLVLLPGDDDPRPATARLLRRLARVDPGVGIGVSESRAGVAGLRIGYYEARSAARRGPGVHHAAPLSPTGLLLANLDLPLAEVGRTGRGRHLDVSMLDSLVAIQVTGMSMLTATGELPGRVGNRHPVSTPFDTYPAGDGPVAIAVANDSVFARFAAMIERPDLAEDPGFATDQARGRRVPELRRIVERWTGCRTVAEVLAAAERAGVPAAPIWGLDEALGSEQIRERGLIGSFDHPRLGPTPYLRQPVRFAAESAESTESTVIGEIGEIGRTRPSPDLGEHCADVLADWLGAAVPS